MTLSRALFLFALIATIFSTIAVATDFVVGDEKGWTLGVDYQAWAADKVFHLGDTLTFNYVAGKDSVVRVNGSDFQSCSVPWAAPVLGSGNDKVVLTTYGRRWYISGFANHCKNGQKLVITVLPSQQLPWSPVPSPSPSPSDAPWSATVPRRSLLSKKLLKMIHTNIIVV
ncbi:blue copper protein 1a-like [Vicia villosa]|uniref:blue copper protein 1a-like n=1 Tax=Vicia villosa TaxID=3911 RepID=UPI00273B81A6|nr:blue copper protein 1a-like [Vicia villosa]